MVHFQVRAALGQIQFLACTGLRVHFLAGCHLSSVSRGHFQVGCNMATCFIKTNKGVREFSKMGATIFSFFFLATPCSTWDLSSLTKDRTGVPCSGSSES